MDGYDYLAGFLLLFVFFIYITWFGFSLKIENEKDEGSKIKRFEDLDVPVDIFAVGSSLFANDGPRVTDFTSDITRVKINGKWQEMSKVGRNRGINPELELVTK